eukprot:TRINITY_DN2591_c0_g4_i4.p1 TRINITY_DN2591_c0_g4~~TRINITY_DN2591_c0_g4_i4.p1  ORF type:complete len:1371 (-),score=467.46 TRINITY_DN2591_c0_g4_i4:168-4280(-)
MMIEAGEVNLTAMKTERKLSGTENSLEFLLVGISKAFKLQPKQAAALFTDGGKYLAHILIKGLRSDYRAVVLWLKTTCEEADHFAELTKREDVSATAFKTFEGGLYSKSEEVCLWTLKLLSKLAADFTSGELESNVWPWLISKNGGLEAILYSYRKYKELRGLVVELLMNLGKGKLSELFNNHIRESLSKGNEFLTFLIEIAHPLSAMNLPENTRKEVNFLLENWLLIAQEKANSRDNIELRLIALRLVCELCTCFADLFEELETKALAVLVKSVRDRSTAFKHYILTLLFEFLECFAIKKRPFASDIYRALVGIFIEHYSDISIRAFIEENFSRLYAEFSSMPLLTLLKPLGKLISEAEELNLCDYAFLLRLLSHAKFSLKDALPLMDLAARTMSEDPVFTSLASFVLFMAFDKCETDESVKECKKNAIRILFNAILVNLKLICKDKAAPQRRYQSYKAIRQEQEKEEESQRIASLMLQIQTEILLRLHSLDDPECNDVICNRTLAVHYRMRNVMKPGKNPLRRVLAKFGDPDTLTASFAASQEQLMSARKEKAKLLAIEGPKAASVASSYEGKGQLVPYKRSKDYRQEAMVTLERIRNSLDEKELSQKVLAERKVKIEERKKKLLKEQVELKNMALGYTARNSTEPSKDLILSEGKLDKILLYTPNTKIQLLDLNEEEDRDREAINLYMRKYNNLFKHLFNRYVNTRLLPKKMAFETLRRRAELISVSEFRKMLSDHGVDSNMVKQEDLITLFRLINVKEGRSDLMNLPYDSFLILFVQIALYIYSKPPFSTLPLVESVKKLKERFMEMDQRRGENVMLYIDPESAGLLPAEQIFLQELQKKAKANPSFTIPEGYKRVTEKEITFSYELLWTQNESMKICSELLDELLSKAIDVHFIEPVVKYKSEMKVRPKENARAPARIEAKLPVNVKLAISELPLELRDIGMEVGVVVEEIVKAVVEKRKEIPNGRKPSKAASKNREVTRDHKKSEEEREKRRQQRHAELKQKLKEDEARKKESEEKKKAEVQKKVQKEKQLKEVRKKEYAEREKRLKEKKELMALKKEEPKKKELEEKKRKEKELRARSKQKRDEIDKMLREEQERRKQEQKDKEEKLAKEKKMKEKRTQIIDNKLKKEKEQYQQVKEQQDALTKFTESQDTQQLFSEYRPHLNCIFEYYSKLDNVELNLAGKSLWRLKTFAKFSKQSRIVPTLITSDLLSLLFKGLVRKKSVIEDVAGLMMDSEGFLKALVMVSAVGADRLGNVSVKPAKKLVLDKEKLKVEKLRKLFSFMELDPQESEKVLQNKLVNLQISYSGKLIAEESKKVRKPSIMDKPKPNNKEDPKGSAELSKLPEADLQEQVIAPDGKKETWDIK